MRQLPLYKLSANIAMNQPLGNSSAFYLAHLAGVIIF
jgi:hypothetical protein